MIVTRLKTGLEYPTTTERDGFYLVVLHLHDEDEGERLGVDARGVKGEVRARFDKRDRRSNAARGWTSAPTASWRTEGRSPRRSAPT